MEIPDQPTPPVPPAATAPAEPTKHAKKYTLPFSPSAKTSKHWLSYTCWTLGILFLGPILLGLYLSRLSREYVNNKTTALILAIIGWFFAVFANSILAVAWADSFTANATYTATAGPNSKATPLPIAKNTATPSPKVVTVAPNTAITPVFAKITAPTTAKTPVPTAKITAAPTKAPSTPAPTAAPTPTPVRTPTPTPVPATPTPTPIPATPTPTPTMFVNFLSGPGSVAKNSYATVQIGTAANAYCSISAGSKSSNNGLASGNADASGHKSWTWRVGSVAGSWPVTVTCTVSRQTANKTAYITVY